MEERLTWTLALGGRAAGGVIAAACRECGLKPAHLHVLALLSDHGPQGQQRLLEEMGVDPSVLVTLLNDLERDGLALRRRDPADRRRHIVELTDQGRVVLARIDRHVGEVERELFAGFDSGLLADFRRLLARLGGIGGGCAGEQETSC